MKSIKNLVRAEVDIKKSKFLAFVHPVRSEDDAKRLLEDIRETYRDASHHCHAYTLSTPPTQNVSDDGEPHRTAGMPMLDVLEKQGLHDVLAVVVRYYGGVKLGAGGLSRAYAGAVTAALKRAESVFKVERVRCRVNVALDAAGRLEHHIRRLVGACDVAYGEDALFTVEIDAADFDAFSAHVMEASAGTARIGIIERYETYR